MCLPNIIFSIPSSFVVERKYLAEVIFSEFINLPYTVEVVDGLHETYSLRIGANKIVFKDCFFSRIAENKQWFRSELIPKCVSRASSSFAAEKDIPVLFGDGSLIVEHDTIFCGGDVFAAIFFMLTRWEELVSEERDYLDRFPVHASLAYRGDFLERPVVNEWVEMLKNMIVHFVPRIEIKSAQPFKFIFTHDIDLLSSPISLREFAKDIVRRRSLLAFGRRLGYVIRSENPYDLFDYFMDISEKHNTLSRFYFMTGHNLVGKDGERYNDTPLYKTVIKKIKKRGHIIGFHPSLFSYNNEVMFLKEKRRLEQDIEQAVTEGRQHALRFCLPQTWKIWEKAGMQIDSTLGYSGREGFRCGTGNIFTVFDVTERKKLRLKEMPLIAMDTTLHVNRKLSTMESKESIESFITLSKKYDMPITLLFHNLIADTIDWGNWKKLHEEIFA